METIVSEEPHDSTASAKNVHTVTEDHADGAIDEEMRKALASLDLNPRRRRWPLLLAGLAVGVAGTLAMVAWLDRNDDDGSVAVEDLVETATAPVETRDLLEEVDWAATLGFGESVSLLSPIDGTVTAGVTIGDGYTRGDTIAVIDDQPVALFYGDQPFFRDLTIGDSGPDVELLESNLVQLGYDTDVTVTVDQDFTANTALMIERWQSDLGLEETGGFSVGAAVVAHGAVVVASGAETGTAIRTGDVIAAVDVAQIVRTVVNPVAGVLDNVASAGTPVAFGSILFTIDEQPIVALVDPDRIGSLLSTVGSSAESLEIALAAEGFDPDGEMTIDGVITDATRAAVGRWQAANGLPVTEVADPTGYITVAPGLVVEGPLILPTTAVVAGRPVLGLTAQTMSVALTVAATDADEFVLGGPVTVESADGSLLDAVVGNIGTIVTPAATADGDDTIEIVVLLTETDVVPVAGPVTVRTISSRIDGALVVPTRALVSLVEGGFAVEKLTNDDATVLVQVEIGTFDDGVVEVESSQLEVGDLLVVPS